MTHNEVPIPWFSGLCLEGEVAEHYELEPTLGPGDPQPNGETAPAGSPPELLLEGLGPITIFVGANNSGKSRLMREAFRSLTFKYIKGGGGNGTAGRLSDLSRRVMRHINPKAEQTSRRTLGGSWHSIGDFDYLEQRIPELRTLRTPQNENRKTWADKIEGIEREFQALKDETPYIHKHQSITRRYIPMLRGMRPPSWPTASGDNNPGTMRDIFLSRTIIDYFEDIQAPSSQDGHYLKHEQLHIFTGLGLYADLQDRMLSPEQEKRQSIIAYQQFLSDHFFAGQPVLLVPALKKHGNGGMNDVVYIKIGDRADYPIHELGDGMQSLIICTYPIVTETRRGCLFFLEEPDLCMHPSLQRTFLEVLKHYHRSMGHQFFLTTHSNHLLDLVDDPDLVSVLSFSEISGNSSPTTSNPNNASRSEDLEQQPAPTKAKFRIRQAKRQDRDLLNQLGVRPSATFLANATIWVEGISDVAYLRAYMEAFLHYLKHWGGEDWKATATQLSAYKEDNHYAFVEYSGANLTHLIFTTEDADAGDDAKQQAQQPSTAVGSLCGHAIVIADGDISEKRQGKRAEEFSAQLRDRFIILPCKEIENLIPVHYVKQQVRGDAEECNGGSVSDDIVEGLAYERYCRLQGDSDERCKLRGIATYLCERRLANYCGSKDSGNKGTLPAKYKQRWRSNSKGIPRKIREAWQAESRQKNATLEDASKAAPSLPSYLTRDLVWLCTCIYTHIAQCNHHTEVHGKLHELRQWMQHLNASNPESSSPTDGGETAAAKPEKWPTHNPGDRECVLHAYATRGNSTN